MKKLLTLGLVLLIAVTGYAQDKIKVACVGNSITYGTGVVEREKNAYPVKLQQMLGDKSGILSILKRQTLMTLIFSDCAMFIMFLLQQILLLQKL